MRSTSPLPLPVPEPLALLDATLLFLIQVLLAQHPDLLATLDEHDDTRHPASPLRAPPPPPPPAPPATSSSPSARSTTRSTPTAPSFPTSRASCQAPALTTTSRFRIGIGGRPRPCIMTLRVPRSSGSQHPQTSRSRSKGRRRRGPVRPRARQGHPRPPRNRRRPA